MVTQARSKRNRAEQAERIRDYLKWNWQFSDREIARQLGSSQPTIGKYRRELESEGEILPRYETFHSAVPCQCEVKTSAIQSPPENDKLYDPVKPDDPNFLGLVKDIERNGIIDPIGVDRHGNVFNGNRRLAAAKILEMDKVPIRIRPDISREDDPDGFLKLLRSCNHQRNKTTAEQTREAVVDANPESWQYLADYRREVSEVDGAEVYKLLGRRKRSAIVQKRGLADAIVKLVKQRYYKEKRRSSDRKLTYLLLNIPGLLRNDVTKTPFLNDDESYQDVTDLLTRLRLDGSIPFDAIVDETRPVILWETHRSVGSFVGEQLEDFLCGYCRDLLQSQPNHIELLVEKNTVADDLKTLAGKYTIPMTSGRGYSSLPPRKGMVDRFRASGKEKLVIIAVSDFDPEGVDIPSSFGISLRDDFGIPADKLHVVKAALTHAQTQELDLHEGQIAKELGSRYKQFTQQYGKRCWELEAVDTDELIGLVERTIRTVINVEAFEAEFDQEQSERNDLSWQRRSAMDALSKTLEDEDEDDQSYDTFSDSRAVDAYNEAEQYDSQGGDDD